jgi:hypothetical protein
MTDMTEQTSGDEQAVDTGATPETDNQVEERIFSQKDVDKIVQQRLEKYKRRFADVDMNEYKSLKSEAEERELEAMKKREEFDKILSQQKDKYSNEITTLRQELTAMKVDGTLLNTASSRNAVNPEQVAQLLRNQVGLDETGRPVVYDGSNVVYDPETAEPKTLESLVNEFLDTNPHFVRATPGGTVSQGSSVSSKPTSGVDLGSLDLNKATDREIYRKLKSEGKI